MAVSPRTVDALRKYCLSLPNVEEETSCNKAAFRAHGKGFLFIGIKDGSYNFLLKLRDSLPEAGEYEKRSPQNYKVGGGNWVAMKFALDESPPKNLIERWAAESYELLVPKKTPKPKSGKPARKPAARA